MEDAMRLKDNGLHTNVSVLAHCKLDSDRCENISPTIASNNKPLMGRTIR